MRKLQLPFGTAVSFTWLDSKAQSGWQYSPDKIREIGVIKTLGRVTQNNKFALSITSSISSLNQSIADLTVPWGAILELEILKSYSLRK